MKRSGAMKRTPMPRGTSTLQAKKPMSRGTAVLANKRTDKKPAPKATMKTRQRAVTAAEQALWSRMAALGCVACMKDGIFNNHVSIHHIDGRTKPGCHQLVLPLCAPHHQQDDTDPMGRISIHGHRRPFEARYGTELELLALVRAALHI